MRTFDTNAIVRIVLGDDPQQAALASEQWAEALRTDGIFLPVVVLVEFILHKCTLFNRETL